MDSHKEVAQKGRDEPLHHEGPLGEIRNIFRAFSQKAHTQNTGIKKSSWLRKDEIVEY